MTDIRLEALTMEGISIHTALAGCDMDSRRRERAAHIFQSTQPSQAVTI